VYLAPKDEDNAPSESQISHISENDKSTSDEPAEHQAPTSEVDENSDENEQDKEIAKSRDPERNGDSQTPIDQFSNDDDDHTFATQDHGESFVQDNSIREFSELPENCITSLSHDGLDSNVQSHEKAQELTPLISLINETSLEDAAETMDEVHEIPKAEVVEEKRNPRVSSIYDDYFQEEVVVIEE
jgi:CBS domain-containing protein